MPGERDDRIKRLKRLREHGVDPYPIESNRTHTIEAARATFDELMSDKRFVTVCCRIRSIRHHGRSFFLDGEDASGLIQLYVQPQQVGESSFILFKETLDAGDIIEARGSAMRTKRGEPTLLLSSLRILSKALQPLPEKWHGLVDTEMRLRQRYLDFIANPSIRRVVELRASVLRSLRAFYDADSFLEVETPVLQPIAGGANARPFTTHHNALDQDFYLRIAPELYLKRLLVGGFERVYEISRNFRNEGIDAQHNPEFSELEAYASYWSASTMREHVEKLFARLSHTILHDAPIKRGEKSISLQPPFPVVSYNELIKDRAGIDLGRIRSEKTLLAAARERTSLVIQAGASRATILDELFKHVARPTLIEPTFVVDYPVESAPLAKRKPQSPSIIDRFQLVIDGMELVNGFSEANDPLDQRERFVQQERARAKGDEEAQRLDEDFLTALEHGMPPAAGMGLGIDRLIVLLAGVHSVKEGIAFPTLKAKQRSGQ